MIPNNLEDICICFLVKHLISFLDKRKHKIGKWFVQFNEWMSEMKVRELKVWIESSVNARILETLRDESIKHLQDARNHDILACIFLITLNKYTETITIPESLKMNEQVRQYLLNLIISGSNTTGSVKKVKFKCYDGGQTFYVGDVEKDLISEAVKSISSRLVLIELPGVATNDFLHVVVKNCLCLQILLLKHNKNLDDQSAEIISGCKSIVKKGQLVKIVTNSTRFCAFQTTLRHLDISYSSITCRGRIVLEKCFPNDRCKITKL